MIIIEKVVFEVDGCYFILKELMNGLIIDEVMRLIEVEIKIDMFFF